MKGRAAHQMTIAVYRENQAKKHNKALWFSNHWAFYFAKI